MTKIVINRCFGGFGLSSRAHALIAKRKGWQHACDDYDHDYWYSSLGNAVYESDLKRDADGDHAELKIVDVPDNVDWFIHEYDGIEEVHECHRSWP